MKRHDLVEPVAIFFVVVLLIGFGTMIYLSGVQQGRCEERWARTSTASDSLALLKQHCRLP